MGVDVINMWEVDLEPIDLSRQFARFLYVETRFLAVSEQS